MFFESCTEKNYFISCITQLQYQIYCLYIVLGFNSSTSMSKLIPQSHLEKKYGGLPKNVKYTYYSIFHLHAQSDEHMAIGSFLGFIIRCLVCRAFDNFFQILLKSMWEIIFGLSILSSIFVVKLLCMIEK